MPTSTTTGLPHSLDYSKEGIAINATRKEQWRPIPGYEGSYEVSDHGNVRSVDRYVNYKTGQRILHRGKILKLQHFQTTGYPYVNLWKNNTCAPRTIHSLVMETFVGPREKGTEVCHNNGVRTDNRLTNLRYGTSTENNLDIIRHGNHANTNKTHCNRGHALQEPNLVPSVKKVGRRQCLACVRARARVNYHKELKGQLQQIADEYYAALMEELK